MIGRLLILLLICSNAWAEPEARTRASIDSDQTLWVGQRVLVHLDLLSNGFSFSGQRFDLPQLNGAVLLQTDSSTLKLTEQVEGESWQGLRYDLSLFAQREGRLEIPAFMVEFRVSQGYGQPETHFELQTEPLTVELNMPPDADPSQPVLTSSRVTVEEQWQPDQVSFKAGEAITRTLIIEAEDISAIALPAIPAQAIEGIDALPGRPLVEDKSNRGSLTGHRREQVSYLFKQAGSYVLPGGSISWWDPGLEKLHKVAYEARAIEVAADPLARAATEGTGDIAEPAHPLRWVLAVLLVLTSILLYWQWPRIQVWRTKQFDSEPARFKRALKACRKNNVKLAWTTINEWLSVTGLAIPDKYRAVWVQLQHALVSGGADWSGRELAEGLNQMRRTMQDQQKKAGDVQLGPLNPISSLSD